MKYFSSQCVANAYKSFQYSMTNKSWGYLALLKECHEIIKPSTPYKIDLCNVSNFLEGIFNLSENKKIYDGDKNLYVVFSSQWKDYFNTQGRNIPNVYDIAIWAFRRLPLHDSVSSNDILSMFATSFNIPVDLLESCFDTSPREFDFSESLYLESDLKPKLESYGVDISKENIDAQKKSVVANPGEISRGPFIQPLYAGLDITDYVMILQSDYEDIYGSVTNTNKIQGTYTLDELVGFYRDLVTSDYSTAGNAIFMATYGGIVKDLKLKAADIYNRAGVLYPSETAKFRAQELNHAFKMYDYFLKHPNKMHLPGIPSTTNNSFQLTTDMPLQQIFYGAPGTGKSYQVNEVSKNYSTVRTTFHPDSDYSTFVGAYKPTMTKVRKSVVIGQDEKEVRGLGGNGYENKIQYSFVKQAFLKAYLGAWKKYTEPHTNVESREEIQPQFLVIEEINRGNCAQIFGDLFQLLDRQEKNGFSCYPIEADADLQQEIENAFQNEAAYKLTAPISVEGVVEGYTSNYQHEDGTPCTLSEDIQSGRILLLPNNLYIWATMNTSDQSLFPIDSAFKRRWEWEYIRISEGRDKDSHEPLRYCFNVNGTDYDWWSFIQKINERVGSITSSEDKKLGYFFCGTEKNISAAKFVSKVCFYLWNDVFKDFGFGKKDQSAAFKKADGKDIAFDDFYKENPDTFKSEVNEVLLGEFINKLGVETVAARQARESHPAQTSSPQQESPATPEE